MTSEDEDPPIIYEPAPTVTPLSGNEAAADATSFATVCWLLRRYSSHTYIARAAALFGGVVESFKAWPHGAECYSAETLRDCGRALLRHQAAFEKGLGLLGRGRTAAAYAALAEAVNGLEPQDPRDERHFSLSQLLEQLGPDATLGGTRAAAMALRIRHTLAADWAYETILADRPSLRLRPLRLPQPLLAVPVPGPDAPEVKSGRKVPQTGIWMPLAIRYGCPNFLVAGSEAPPLTHACERIDYEAVPAAGGEPAAAAWSDYEFTTQASSWRLVWADPRYQDGKLADEAGLLDEENALPAP